MSTLVEIKNDNKIFTVTPTISETTYTAGDALGGINSLPDIIPLDGSSSIESIVLLDKGKKNSRIDIVFFKSLLSSTTITDNAAIDINNADLTHIIGNAKINELDYIDFDSNSFAIISEKNIPLVSASGHEIYFAMIERGTPTRTTGDIIVNFLINCVGA